MVSLLLSGAADWTLSVNGADEVEQGRCSLILHINGQQYVDGERQSPAAKVAA